MEAANAAAQVRAELSIGHDSRVLHFVLSSIVVVGGVFSVLNLAGVSNWDPVPLVGSVLWLLFIWWIVRDGRKEAAGLGKYLLTVPGNVIGRFFAEIGAFTETDKQPVVRFGFRLLGWKVVQRSIALSKIHAVKWDMGQASGMTGRDMNDWLVFLYYDHDKPAESERRRNWKIKTMPQWTHPFPDQDLICVGPAKRKEITEKFALKFVDFLRVAGVRLERSENENRFTRPMP